MSHHKYEPGIHYWESCLDQCKIRENGWVLCVKQYKPLAQTMNVHHYNCFYINLIQEKKKLRELNPVPHHHLMRLHYSDSCTGTQWLCTHVLHSHLCQYLPDSSCMFVSSLWMGHIASSVFCTSPCPALSALHYFSGLQSSVSPVRSPCSALLAVLSSNTNLSHRYSHLSI